MFSCSTEKIEPNIVTLSAQYFPIDNNQEQVFEIYELDYTISGIDTTHVFQLERTTVIYKDQDSLYATVNVLRADTEDGAYASHSTYSLTIEGNQLIQNKENERYILLGFPISQGQTFDVNGYNLEPSIRASVSALDKTIATSDFTGDQSYSNALKIQLEKVNNNIITIDNNNIYQENKGLVYQTDISLDQQPGQTPIGHKNIKIRIK